MERDAQWDTFVVLDPILNEPVCVECVGPECPIGKLKAISLCPSDHGMGPPIPAPSFAHILLGIHAILRAACGDEQDVDLSKM